MSCLLLTGPVRFGLGAVLDAYPLDGPTDLEDGVQRITCCVPTGLGKGGHDPAQNPLAPLFVVVAASVGSDDATRRFLLENKGVAVVPILNIRGEAGILLLAKLGAHLAEIRGLPVPSIEVLGTSPRRWAWLLRTSSPLSGQALRSRTRQTLWPGRFANRVRPTSS